MHAVWISLYVVWWFRRFISTVGTHKHKVGQAVCDGLQSSYDRMAVGSMAGHPAPYLVLLGDVLLVVLLHLPELGLQTTELDLHLLHILQVPLGSLVQHLDGLGHVLDLPYGHIGLSHGINLYV